LVRETLKIIAGYVKAKTILQKRLKCVKDDQNYTLISCLYQGACMKTKSAGKNVLVSVVMGSDSDLPIMTEAAKILDEFGIGYELILTSAHRTPKRTTQFAKTAASRA